MSLIVPSYSMKPSFKRIKKEHISSSVNKESKIAKKDSERYRIPLPVDGSVNVEGRGYTFPCCI